MCLLHKCLFLCRFHEQHIIVVYTKREGKKQDAVLSSFQSHKVFAAASVSFSVETGSTWLSVC